MILVGGHHYKFVVAMHKITGNVTAFYYLSNLIEVIKVTTGDHTYTTHLSNLIWNKITTLHTHFYFLFCAFTSISPVNFTSHKTDYVTFNNLILCHNTFQT